MNLTLALIAVVIFLCVFLNKVSSKLGIPVLLAFIGLGMIFGSDGILKIPFDNYRFVEEACSVALIFIMFYGGFGTNLKEAKSVAKRSVLMSTVGVVLTAGFLGVFCHFVLGLSWTEGLLLGSLLGSTDAASVFSILRSKKLNLRYNTASLLEVESGSNDPMAYMLTAIMIAVMKGEATVWSLVYMLFSQLVYGAAAGIVIAFVSMKILKKVKFKTTGFDTVFVFAVALLSYAFPSLLGGNGYLSTYIVGFVLGNARIPNKKTLVPFFDGINGLMQMMIFFLLGLLSYPTKIFSVILPSMVIAFFLTFVARPLAVFLIFIPFKSKLSQKLLVSWAGLRGAASIVFAVMAVMSVQTEHDIFHIVFCVVLFSILIQGTLLPFVSKKLNMIDETGDVMKTFTDYSDEVPIQFIKFTVKDKHPWCNSKIRNLTLPPDTILVMLIREKTRIVPKGNTVLNHGDTLILCAKSSGNIEGVHLSEKRIEKDDENIGMKISDIMSKNKNNDDLIIMIQRNEKVIIPNGNTKLHENDVLVINHQ